MIWPVVTTARVVRDGRELMLSAASEVVRCEVALALEIGAAQR